MHPLRSPGHNCRHCGEGPKHGKRAEGMPGYSRHLSLRRWRPEALLDAVREIVLQMRAKMLALGESATWWDMHVRREKIAWDLRAKRDMVEHALHCLNLEGLVAQPRHHAPHDSTRERPWGYGSDSAWCGDTYRIRRENEGT